MQTLFPSDKKGGLKTIKKLSLPLKSLRNTRGVSSVISTIIITGALMVILLIASFVATNVLSLQLSSTEFEIAKKNMLVIDSTIQDVALRLGSSSFVQFNMQAGGIGISQPKTETFQITVSEGPLLTTPLSLTTYDLIYRAPTQTSAAAIILRGNETIRDSSAITTSQPQGYIEVYHNEGAKIKLEYDRVKVIEVGRIDDQTNLVEIKIITIEKGDTTGSGVVNVRLQNTNMETYSYSTSLVEDEQVIFDYADKQTTLNFNLIGETVFLVTVITIQVNIT